MMFHVKLFGLNYATYNGPKIESGPIFGQMIGSEDRGIRKSPPLRYRTLKNYG